MTDLDETNKERKGLTLAQKEAQNVWDHVEDFWAVYQQMKAGKWRWVFSKGCKYVDLRVDMRDGGCLISAGGKRIDPEDLAFQSRSLGAP